MGKLSAIVVLSRWCYFQFFFLIFNVTEVQCCVPCCLQSCIYPCALLQFQLLGPRVGVCEGWWYCFIFMRCCLQNVITTCLGRLFYTVLYCFKQEAKNQLFWLCNSLGKYDLYQIISFTHLWKAYSGNLDKLYSICIISFLSEQSWTGVVINLFESNMLGITKWKKIIVDLHVEIG